MYGHMNVKKMRSIIETSILNDVQENNQTKHENCISRLQRFGCSGIVLAV